MLPYFFGKYQILELLAQGGMARVFKATAPGVDGNNHLVALKRIRKEFADEAEFVTRFIDEARIASTFCHENIVAVTDYGTVAGEPFLVMELVKGIDLRSLIQNFRARRRPIPIWAVVYISTQIARGLEAAHCRVDSSQKTAPVVHRDISPQNILLSWTGQVKITDFGVAKAAEKALLTRTGVILGKWRYMAPEQASGAPVDCRADVFSTGCVIFELLTGRPLFEGQGPEQIVQNVLQMTIPSVAEIRDDVPLALQEILRRALARPLDQRFAHGGELAGALAKCLDQLAPGTSRGDLRCLIADLQERPAIDRNEDSTLALAETVESGSSEKPTTAEFPHHREGETAIAATRTLLAQQTTALLEPSPSAVSPRPWSAASMVIGGMSLGFLVGALLGLAGHYAGAKEVAPGQKIFHEGWTLHIDRMERVTHRGGNHLAMDLRVQHPTADRATLSSFFILQQGHRMARPLFCAQAHTPSATKLRLLFSSKPESALRFRFKPDRGSTLALRLP